MGHGQASVKRGFNDKKSCLKVNMEEIIIVTRRYIKIMFMPMQ